MLLYQALSKLLGIIALDITIVLLQLLLVSVFYCLKEDGTPLAIYE